MRVSSYSHERKMTSTEKVGWLGKEGTLLHHLLFHLSVAGCVGTVTVLGATVKAVRSGRGNKRRMRMMRKPADALSPRLGSRERIFTQEPVERWQYRSARITCSS